MKSTSTLCLLLVILITTAVSGQSGGFNGTTTCGTNTELDLDTNLCVCISGDDPPEDPSRIYIAGLMDTDNFPWCPDIFEFTVEQINKGRWGVLDQSKSQYLVYSYRNSQCDANIVVQEYWDLRKQNGDKAMDGVVGERCSDASESLARITGLEEVPQISPASNSATLTSSNTHRFFSRLVAPNNAEGEVGALVALLRSFKWERVTTISTDAQFAKEFTTEFTNVWTREYNDESGSRNGVIEYSHTISTDNKTISLEAIRQALKAVGKPEANSRIIVLAAHAEHAFEILEEAHRSGFQEDTIWVGNSGWIGREPPRPYILPKLPGYLGVGLYLNRNKDYEAFMADYKIWLENRNKTALEQLPVFAAETIDSIIALTKAIAFTPVENRTGSSVVQYLRQLDFPGVSGRVHFTDEGDRKDPLYTIFNAQRQSREGVLEWTDVGQVGTELTSVSFASGREAGAVCFAQVGCDAEDIPKDTYPVPGVPLPPWTIVIIVVFGLLFGIFAFKYSRSRAKKNRIKAELEAFRASVVGLRAAECDYIPRVSKDIECGVESSLTETRTDRSIDSESVQWCWQETDGFMDTHDANEIFGDPAGNWIKYSGDCNDMLECAFLAGQAEFSPLPGYAVNFKNMQQTKLSTNFTRAVKRVVEPSQDNKPKILDLSKVQLGASLPHDLAGEPQLVLVSGDIIQIQTQRDDGWAFGSKIHHADEATARQMVVVATGSADGVVNGEVSVLTDSGWFPMDRTRMPSTEDLMLLQKNISTGDLDPPEHWDPISDATVVQRHPLLKGDPECVAVVDAFMSTLRSPGFKKAVSDIKVERIQNFAMWQGYIIKRQTICYRETGHAARDNNCEVQRNALKRFERSWLWHGTNIEVMDKILQQGFNRSFCGKNATAYGKGVYFARDASYSVDPTYAVPDGKRRQYVMACRVVVGEYCLGHHNAVTPDVRDPKTHSLYDSTVGLIRNDTMASPSIYVTYHDAQAYPEYLITFKTSE